MPILCAGPPLRMAALRRPHLVLHRTRIPRAQVTSHARSPAPGARPWRLCADGGLCAGLRARLMVPLLLGGAVTAFLLIYLLWALLRPEDL
ncbi:K(+)-transporting ATPase subunit F [Siccirubricoccus soli]|uniref:K(+)-transporting ATPase subunit F n=1 Tax=Siccirubricoccus soli TaxID=2899147 RepID=UPI003515A79F